MELESHKNSVVLNFLIREYLEEILRPLWLRDVPLFESTLAALDCYPFRVSYILGQQMWIEEPREACEELDEYWFKEFPGEPEGMGVAS